MSWVFVSLNRSLVINHLCLEPLCKDLLTITSTERSFPLGKKKSRHHFLPVVKQSLCLAKPVENKLSVDLCELTGCKVKFVSRPDMFLVCLKTKSKPQLLSLCLFACETACVVLLPRISLDMFVMVCGVLSENFRLFLLIFFHLLLLAVMLVFSASFNSRHKQCS